MIQLTKQIFSIEVPRDAKYEVISHVNGSGSMWELYLKSISTRDELIHIPFPFEILGEVTESEITFDVDLILDKDDETGSYPYFENREGKNAICFNKEQSFRSLLQSKEIYFVNPIKKPKYYDEWYKWGSFSQHGESIVEESKKYHTAESNQVKGKLLILKNI